MDKEKALNCIVRRKRGSSRAKYHVVFQEGHDWGRDVFFLGGGEFEGFGASVGKRETKAHAVERAIACEIKDINSEIAELERKKHELIGILDDYASK